MKIVHVIQSMEAASGGPPVVVSRLAAAQARLGHQVVILAQDRGDTRLQLSTLALVIEGFDQIEWRLIGTGKLGLWRGNQVSQVLEANRGPDTIVHLHGIWDPILWSAARAALKHGTKYVVAPHGMLDPWSLQRGKWKKRLALALGFRAMLEKAAFLHVLNDNEKTQAERLKLHTRMAVIPNGVNEAEFQIAKSAAFDTGHNPGNKPYILFLGRLHHKKGLDYLAEAFALVAAKNPLVNLVVAGPDYGEKTRFEQRLAELGLNNRVRLVGEVQGAAKIRLLREATCFCLPSRSEGFSIAILEALASGLPVVISKTCHFPQVAEQGAGQVVALDAPQIARALLDFLDNKSKRHSAGRAAYELVKNHYTWAAIAERTIGNYQNVLPQS